MSHFEFFRKQEHDEAGRAGVRLQKVLLVLLFLFLFEHLFGIISLFRLKPEEREQEIQNGQFNYNPNLARNPSSQFIGELISFILFIPLFLLGFISSYKRHRLGLLIYIILNILWLIFVIIVLALFILLIILMIGFVFGAISASPNGNNNYLGDFDTGRPVESPNQDESPNTKSFQYDHFAPSSLRAFSHLARQYQPNPPFPPQSQSHFMEWIGLFTGLGSLILSFVSLVFWIISICLAVRQRNQLLLIVEIPQFIVQTSDPSFQHVHVQSSDPLQQGHIHVQPFDPNYQNHVQYVATFPINTQFQPTPQPFGVKD